MERIIHEIFFGERYMRPLFQIRVCDQIVYYVCDSFINVNLYYYYY